MCYADPGPRCSYHVKKNITQLREQVKNAREAGDGRKVQEYGKKLSQELEAYKRTPEHINQLFEQGDFEGAVDYQAERQEMMERYKDSQPQPKSSTMTINDLNTTEATHVWSSKNPEGIEHSYYDRPSAIIEWEGHRSESWAKNGVMHRSSGPALVNTNTYNNTETRTYMVNGKEVDPAERKQHREYENMARVNDALRAEGATPLNTRGQLLARYYMKDKEEVVSNDDAHAYADTMYEGHVENAAGRSLSYEEMDQVKNRFPDAGVVLNGQVDKKLSDFIDTELSDDDYPDSERDWETRGFYEH